eukprot:c48444_g1_i1 orf=162-371(+)
MYIPTISCPSLPYHQPTSCRHTFNTHSRLLTFTASVFRLMPSGHNPRSCSSVPSGPHVPSQICLVFFRL